MAVHSQKITQSTLNVIRYDEATLVTSNNLTTILTFTAIKDTNISLITCSGDDYAKFQLFIDTVLIATKRSGPKRNTEWNFNNPLLLNSGSILDVKVTHWHTGDVLNFESTLYAYD